MHEEKIDISTCPICGQIVETHDLKVGVYVNCRQCNTSLKITRKRRK